MIVFIAVILSVIMIIFMITSIFFLKIIYDKNKNCDECIGVLVDIREAIDISRGCFPTEVGMNTPIVAYEVNGQRYVFISNYSSTNMQVGRNVRVMYDRNNPANAFVKNAIYLVPFVTSTMAVAVGMASAILWCIYFFG